MSFHRYINLDVGYDLVSSPGGGRKGGEKKHAPYEEAERVARRVEEILRSAGQRDSLLSKYTLMQVEPSPAHGPKPKASK
jgi:hypothetical protein